MITLQQWIFNLDRGKGHDRNVSNVNFTRMKEFPLVQVIDKRTSVFFVGVKKGIDFFGNL